MLVCEREGCDNQYEKNTHNQKYCSRECLREASNAEIMKRYHERKSRRAKGSTRTCANCTARLSRYNDGILCFSCGEKKETQSNETLAYILMNSNVV
jgi:hypothetical protein